jgi:dTMP kinase
MENYWSKATFPGKLIVIEGSDGSGRSTHVRLLQDYLERAGFPVKSAGLKESELLGSRLDEIMGKNLVCPRTLALLYATDFAETLEKVIIPSLEAGFLVVADRYVFSLIARAAVRGVDESWLKSIYRVAVKPNLVLFLDCPSPLLAERHLSRRQALDYWESGLDLGRVGGMYDSFIRYQDRVRAEYLKLADKNVFKIVDSAKRMKSVSDKIWSIVEPIIRE